MPKFTLDLGGDNAGLTDLYALVYDAEGQFRRSSGTFEAANESNYADYAVTLTEAMDGIYQANVGTLAAGGPYWASVRQGSSPAVTDPNIGGTSYPVHTDGSAVLSLYGTRLAAAGLDAVLVESGIAASTSLVNDSGTQLTSINARQALAAMLSTLAANLAGAATTEVTTRPAGKAASPARVTGTVDASGNRSGVSLRVPD